MPSSGRWMALFAGEFRRLRAATYFAHGGKVGKTPPGTAPDEHFVLIVAFPRTPLRGTRTCQVLQCFRRAKFEWLSAVQSGPLGPGIPKIETNAVPVPRLALLSRGSLVRIPAGGPRASPTQFRKNFLRVVGEGLKVNRPKAERSHPGVCLSRRPVWDRPLRPRRDDFSASRRGGRPHPPARFQTRSP